MVTRARMGAVCLLLGCLLGCEAFLDTDEPALKLETGVPCGGDPQCVTGHCVDGVCCASACDGKCVGCSSEARGAAAEDGVCAPATSAFEEGCAN